MGDEEHPDWLRLTACPKCRYDFTGLSDSLRCPECGIELGPRSLALVCWTHPGAVVRTRFYFIQIIVFVFVLFLFSILYKYLMPVIAAQSDIIPCSAFFGMLFASGPLTRLIVRRSARPNVVLLLGDDALTRVQLRSNLFERVPWNTLRAARIIRVSRRTQQLLITYDLDPPEHQGPFNVTIQLDDSSRAQLLERIEHHIREASSESLVEPCPPVAGTRQ